MTKTVADSPSNAGIWIDHRRAQIVALTPDGPVTTKIESHVEKHPGRSGDSPMKGRYEARQVPADDSRQRALTGELDGYYDVVIAGLHTYGQLFLFGPGEAKGELHARLVKGRQGTRVSAVESEGLLTDRQIVARVRAHFGSASPRAQVPR
jgi:hypothetical protein